jgi:hypothetical protein
MAGRIGAVAAQILEGHRGRSAPERLASCGSVHDRQRLAYVRHVSVILELCV